MPKERSGGPRLDWSCNWEKYGYDREDQDKGICTRIERLELARLVSILSIIVQHAQERKTRVTDRTHQQHDNLSDCLEVSDMSGNV